MKGGQRKGLKKLVKINGSWFLEKGRPVRCEPDRLIKAS
jgi:hypothetical protein